MQFLVLSYSYYVSLFLQEDETDFQSRRPFSTSSAPLNDIAKVEFIQLFLVFSISTIYLLCYSYLQSDTVYDPFAERRQKTIAEKEDEYRAIRRRMIISPERVDPFAEGLFCFFKTH